MNYIIKMLYICIADFKSKNEIEKQNTGIFSGRFTI